jgi:sialate O-acetylesterase
MKLPTLWESAELGEFDGVVWFRKKVNIPSSWLNKDIVLQLGPIDDMDITFINGKKVGSYEETGFYNVNRVYSVSKELVTDSVLTIAVRVVDNGGGGGLWGKSDLLKIYPKDSSATISLAGMWKYLPVAEYASQYFYVFGPKNDVFFTRPKLSLNIGPGVPTMLYNGMIAPVVPFGIKGAIWYQGEENVKNASMYDMLFPLMIKNWFYYVQIAPYNYGESSQSQVVREAQLKSLSVHNTGMAVTSDIGNVNNIHPTDKKDVGERLALWVLAKNYHKKVVFSGPVFKKMNVKGNKIIISFDYAEGGLVIKDKNGDNTFVIAGSDKVFKKADVKVEGEKLIISNPDIDKPVAVRYNWSNTAEATLFNGAQLPASCFRTDNWEK